MSTTVVEVPRKRHRGRRAIIAIVVVIALLIAAFFVADYFVKKYATDYVQQQVATALGLSSTAPVAADLGSGSILLQAATGKLNDVTVDVNPLVIDGLTGSATVVAHGVPLSSTTPVDELHVNIDIPETTITKAISQVSSLAPYKPVVTISGDHVVVAGSFSIFGLSEKIMVALQPKVSAGKPSFVIDSASFGGATISVAQLNKYIPGLSAALQSSTTLCIADQLPKSFVLTGIALQGSSLVSTFTGNGVELNDASLKQKGTCK